MPGTARVIRRTLLVGARSEHLTRPDHTAPPSPPLSLRVERAEERGHRGSGQPPSCSTCKYGWERTTEREERGMCPEGAIRLKAGRGPIWDTGERKTKKLKKEKHIAISVLQILFTH